MLTMVEISMPEASPRAMMPPVEVPAYTLAFLRMLYSLSRAWMSRAVINPRMPPPSQVRMNNGCMVDYLLFEIWLKPRCTYMGRRIANRMGRAETDGIVTSVVWCPFPQGHLKIDKAR